MMSEMYGFFNSQLIDGEPDRAYEAADFAGYYAQLVGNGVFADPSTNLQVQPDTSSSLTIKVKSGAAFINGYWYKLSEDKTITLDSNFDTSKPRFDAILLTLNLTLRTIVISVSKGAIASSIPAPTLVRNDTQYQLCLAQVAVPPSSASQVISASQITDRRPHATYCGWVTGLIDQIDTTNLFAQFAAAWNTWFSQTKEAVKDFTLVRRYSNKAISSSANQKAFAIGIPQYNIDLDILNVYVNGMRLIPTVDYTNTSATVTLTNGLGIIGTVVSFEVLKSIDTEGVESVVSTVETHTQQLGGCSFRRLTRAQYDALVNPSRDTVYIVTEENEAVVVYVGEVQVSGGIEGVAVISSLGTQGYLSEAGTATREDS